MPYRDNGRPLPPNLAATIEQGLVGCMVYDACMPDDVQRHLRDLDNGFHNGAGVSYMEMLADHKSLNADWQAYKISAQVSSKGTAEAAIEKVCWRWLTTNFPGRCRSYNTFAKTVRATTKCIHRLRRWGVAIICIRNSHLHVWKLSNFVLRRSVAVRPFRRAPQAMPRFHYPVVFVHLHLTRLPS